MRLRKVGAKVRRDMKRLVERRLLNAVDVILHYEADAPAGDYDPYIEADRAPFGGKLTCTVGALVHYVTPESVVQRGYTEIAVGDVIVDFAHDVALDGKRNISFEIAGEHYDMKNVGRGLTRSWDVMIGGMASTTALTGSTENAQF